MKKTHFLSLLLTVVMLVTLLFPTGLFAEEVPAEDGAEETIVVTVTEDAPDASDEDDAADVTEEDAADDAAAVTEEDATAEAAEDDGADDAAAVTEEDAGAEVAEEDGADDAAAVTEEDAAAEAAEEDGADDTAAVTEEDAGADGADDAAVTEEDAGAEAAEEDGADDAAVVTEEDETAVSEEDGEAEAEEEDGEEEAAFAEGYVKVAGGTAVYASESKQDQLGAFTSDAAVYAVVSSPVEDEAFSWLKITFDTEEAKAAGDALLTGYVQFKDVSVLSDEAAAQLTVELLRVGARSYGDHPLPAVAFEAKAEEASDPAEDETVVDSDPVVTATVNQETAYAGDLVEFSATVSGSTGSLTYRWQKSTDGENWSLAGFNGYKTATMSFEAIKSRLNYQYRCAVTDANGTWYSNIVSIQFVSAPVITAEVNRDSAYAGDYVEFTATCANTQGTLAYLWQKSTDGENWSSAGFTGYKTATMHFDAIRSRLNYQYRCAVTDERGTWYSNIVSILFLSKPVITATANCETAHTGDSVEFTATCANTVGSLTYKWQKSTDGSEWSDVSLAGYDKAVMSFAAIQSRLNCQYRCAVTDDNGTWYSNPVSVLFVPTDPVITATANCESARAGDTVVFTATAEDTVGSLTYRWQKSTDGENWSLAGFNGYKTATMSFEAIKSRLNYKYRCAVTDDNGTWYSNIVSIKFIPNPVITAATNCESARSGDTVEFTATAKDTVGSLTYRWQKSTNGENWSLAGFSGYKTATMSFEAIKSRLNYQFRCAVTDDNGTWYSNIVSIQYIPNPVITATVNRESAFAGDYVEFSATCENTAGTVKYLWQKSTDGENWSSAGFTGYKTATMHFDAIKSRLNYQYRCAVTDERGTWYSNTVSVQYLTKPVITATANCESASAGDYVEFTATCENTVGTLKYLWQKSTDGENWSSAGFTGYKTATMHFDAIKSRLNYKYRCAVTDDNGTWYSNTVKVEYVRIIEIDGVTYEPITETTCRVVSYSGTASALVIPTEVEGMTVVEIGVEAFMGNTSLTSIDLPNTITVIKARAFKNCTNLTEMRTH